MSMDLQSSREHVGIYSILLQIFQRARDDPSLAEEMAKEALKGDLPWPHAT